jgi:hypothetical protein
VHLDFLHTVARARLAAPALDVKRESSRPYNRASGLPAKRGEHITHIGANAPVYVAAFERGVRPIGLWSMFMILSMYSMPLNRFVFARQFSALR